MAEQVAQNVVNSTQSAGGFAPSDVPEISSTSFAATGEGVGGKSGSGVQTQYAQNHTQAADGSGGEDAERISVHGNFQDGTHSNDATQYADSGTDDNSSQLGRSPHSRFASLAESADQSRRERSNSIQKKTASFKAVSVTKNFLARSNSGDVTSAKGNGDRASPIGQGSSASAVSAKPRLIAKSWRDARPTGSPSNSNKTAPDPMTVWNRNRPAAPAPPKQFTDEELKQQYGIHLATRLQTDEPKKGSNWADIEDDDDWAPEAMEWMDGTKASMQPTEDMQAPRQNQNEDVHKYDGTAPTLTTPEPVERPTSLSSGKTVLKPGTRLAPGQTKPGLILKTVPEGPVSVTKQPTPGPSKSPWAQLPPVDKASPIAFNPPAQSHIRMHVQQQNLTQEDAGEPTETSHDMASPTPEIAADDFDRSWRDSGRGARELFDSKSGKYEPAPPNRRSSSRQEGGGFRPPAVLQRPSQSSVTPFVDHSAQTSARPAGLQDARTWDRRRNSSHAISDRVGGLSQRVEDVARHMSKEAHTSNDARTDTISPSQSAGVSGSVLSPADSTRSPASLKNATLSTRESTGPAAYSAQPPENHTFPHSSTSSHSDFHHVQQQVMKQSIEANRRRKQEEQAREEAEKQERIRQKLLALGEPQSKTETSPEQSQAVAMASKTASPPVFPKDSHHFHSQNVQPNAVPPTPPLSNDTLPVSSVNANVTDKTNLGFNQNERKEGAVGNLPHALPDTMPFDLGLKGDQSAQKPKVKGGFEPHSTGWNGASTAVGMDWPTNLMASRPAHSGNVWGPPTGEHNLGNGSFDKDMRNISMSLPHQQENRYEPGPGPIGPPTASPIPKPRNNPRVSSAQSLTEQSGSQDGAHRNNAAQSKTLPRFPNGGRYEPGIGFFDTFAQMQKDFLAEAVDRDRQPQPQASSAPRTFRETFKKVEAGPGLSRRFVDTQVNTRRVDLEDSGTDATIPSQEQLPEPSIGPVSIHSHSQAQPQAPIGRSSRFFGNRVDPSIGNKPESSVIGQPSQSQLPEQQSTDAPPHNLDDILFDKISDSTSHHPLVNLPRPPPKVKLPPSTSATATSLVDPSTSPQQFQPIRFGIQPIVNQAAWQHRFNDLFGKKGIIPPSAVSNNVRLALEDNSMAQPLDVTASTRATLDVRNIGSPQPSNLTVSLPSGTGIPLIAVAATMLHANAYQVKPDDSCLWDEPENGSKPTVILPRILSEEKWDLDLMAVLPRAWQPMVLSAPVRPFTAALAPPPLEWDKPTDIFIKLPGRGAMRKELIRKQRNSPWPKKQSFAPRSNNPHRYHPNSSSYHSTPPEQRKMMKPTPARGTFGNKAPQAKPVESPKQVKTPVKEVSKIKDDAWTAETPNPFAPLANVRENKSKAFRGRGKSRA